MIGLVRKYTNWLHTQWPAGKPEKLPVCAEDGSTNVKNVYIVGDLSGIPLLKFSLDTGTKAVRTIVNSKDLKDFRSSDESKGKVLDLVIVGAGVAGVAAAVEAQKQSLNYKIIESSDAFSTIINFPKRKPIYTYPTEMEPAGDLKATAGVKEELLDELEQQRQKFGVEIHSGKVDHIERRGDHVFVDIQDQDGLLAHAVIIAIGRSGNYRKLGVPGEELDKVYNRLHDPLEYNNQNVLVVGGGDSALESAIALAEAGATVTLSYRKPDFSRPKPDNIERLNQFQSSAAEAGKVRVLMASSVQSIETDSVVIQTEDGEQKIANDSVFPMIGREAPLDFFRKSGIDIRGEFNWKKWVLLGLFLVFVTFVYLWKNSAIVVAADGSTFPKSMLSVFKSLGASVVNTSAGAEVIDRRTLVGTLAISMCSPSFYYTLAYTLCIGTFGYWRIKRRKTQYVKWQTTALFLVQAFPLFILPEIVLPYLGYNGFYQSGIGKYLADHLFDSYAAGGIDSWANGWLTYAHPRAYWKAYGFVLAWPLNVYNLFTDSPNWAWIWISIVQTCVIIPGLVFYYGKGAYCGWICSCGALAETMGDTHREKMPHGPIWNRLNMLGQIILAVAVGLLVLRIVGWTTQSETINKIFSVWVQGKLKTGVNPISYKYLVDILLGGILGVGLYFWFSGRTWCRFACPLAALMHIYARFSRFRIIADKKKCISCNVCTSVCHQGIDVMNFANKGEHMSDPECVRCSACVQSCPTGVLQFGQVDSAGNVLNYDSLSASPVRAIEASGSGKMEV